MNAPIGMPEFNELEAVLGRELAHRLAPAPGGWRTLSPSELEDLGLSTKARARVQSLQRLAKSRPPSLPFGALANAETVGGIYKDRIGGLDHEVVLALALDGRNHVIQELELARGGLHGTALTPGDVFRPLVRASASAAILVHNHPSGDPAPSPEDVKPSRPVPVSMAGRSATSTSPPSSAASTRAATAGTPSSRSTRCSRARSSYSASSSPMG